MIPHVKLYASIVPARLECPKCSTIIQFGYGNVHHAYYDSPRSRVMCPSCRKGYYLGMMIWNAYLGRSGDGPPDVVRGPEHLSELRRRAGGFWTAERYVKETPINRYEDVECSCAPLPWSAACPIHGSILKG